MNKNEVTPVQIAIRIAIIIIVIAVLLLISFAMVRFVPKLLSSLSGVRGFFGGSESLVLTLDKTTIDQEEEAELSVKQTGGKDKGNYEISFACGGGHRLRYLS